MKNNILTFLLGVFVTISIAATIPNKVFDSKPVKPQQIFIYEFHSYSDAYNIINQKHKEGFIVKTMIVKYSGLLIMEKY